MRIDILSLFPEMFASPFGYSIIRRAVERGLADIHCHNIRDYAEGRHLQVDDTPYGGGQGMVMQVDVLARCIRSIERLDNSRLICLSPRGKTLDQDKVLELAAFEQLILLCGHYEGMDERVLTLVDEQISIGDYVLSGGELPAMIVVDAVVRELPGSLGNSSSALDESFRGSGLLEHPQYTRPAEFEGMAVPEVLLSGHHENIRKWRRKESLRATLLNRPELLLSHEYDREERQLLCELLFGPGKWA